MTSLTRRLQKLEGKAMPDDLPHTILVSFVGMTPTEASRAWADSIQDCITRLPAESEDVFIERAKAHYGPGNPIRIIYLDDGHAQH